MKVIDVIKSVGIAMLVFSFACQMSTSLEKRTDIKLAFFFDDAQWLLKRDGTVFQINEGVSEEVIFADPIVGLAMITNSVGVAVDNQGNLWRKHISSDW